jgi:hypothetical protein
MNFLDIGPFMRVFTPFGLGLISCGSERSKAQAQVFYVVVPQLDSPKRRAGTCTFSSLRMRLLLGFGQGKLAGAGLDVRYCPASEGRSATRNTRWRGPVLR